MDVIKSVLFAPTLAGLVIRNESQLGFFLFLLIVIASYDALVSFLNRRHWFVLLHHRRRQSIISPAAGHGS